MIETLQLLAKQVRSIMTEKAIILPFDTTEKELFINCYMYALEKTVKITGNGEIFVTMGHTPAMDLYDATMQIAHYLPLAKEHNQFRFLLRNISLTQMKQVLIDPYANAFKEETAVRDTSAIEPETHPSVWERKYKPESLSAVIRFAYLLWQETGEVSHLSGVAEEVFHRIIDLWRFEQDHSQSSYVVQGDLYPNNSGLINMGHGSPTAITGLTWCGFRADNTACQYHYAIASNLYAALSLEQVAQIAAHIFKNKGLMMKALTLKDEILEAVHTFAYVDHPDWGQIYAYEIDGLGHTILPDRAGGFSLLALPYMGSCFYNDPVYLNTRQFLLEALHQPQHCELGFSTAFFAMQMLTSPNNQEKDQVLEQLLQTNTRRQPPAFTSALLAAAVTEHYLP